MLSSRLTVPVRWLISAPLSEPFTDGNSAPVCEFNCQITPAFRCSPQNSSCALAGLLVVPPNLGCGVRLLIGGEDLRAGLRREGSMTLPESHEDQNMQPPHGLRSRRRASEYRQVVESLQSADILHAFTASSSAPALSPVTLPEAVPAVPSNALQFDAIQCDGQSPPDRDLLVSEQLEETLRAVVGERDFQQWFQTRSRIAVDDDRLQVFVPNPFLLKWMSERFRADLSVVASRLLGPSGNVQFEVDARLAAVAAPVSAEESAEATVTNPHSQAPSGNGQSFQDSVSASIRSVQRRGSTVEPAASGTATPRSRRRFRSFETFISGECNNIAAMAAMQVANQPGERYNPLFVYGATGTGKTHLLEAVYTEVRRKDPAAQVMYLTSEGFTNYFTSALRERTVPSFRQKFRNVDVLLVDNIEFLDNKRATQEEFLHTIVQVIEHGGQVVISSDRHPRMLTRQREELTTRFLSGLVCRMDVPDEETRRSMAAFFLKDLQDALSPEAVEFVVRHCKRGVREIQGAINQLESCYRLTKKRVSGSRARQLLGTLQEESRRLVRISDVEKVVCDAFGISAAELRSSSRRRLLAVPRAIAMFLSRRLTGSAYREIGLYFGGRDHSTVVAAEKKISRQISEETAVGLPTASRSRTVSELTDYLEQQLQSVAS